MKKPLVDLGKIQLSKYKEQTAFIRKLLRYWGTTSINGVEVLNLKNHYYVKPGLTTRWTPYNDVFNSIVTGHEADVPSSFPPRDSTQRKLLEFFGMWKDVKNQEIEGVDYAWLYLNPELSPDAVKTIESSVLSNGLQKTVDNIKDKHGYCTFTVTLLGNNNWIPSDVTYSGSAVRDWTFKYTPTTLYQDLEIPLYRNYTMVNKEYYVRDSSGNIIYEGTTPKTTTVALKSHVDTLNYLQLNKTDTWKYHAVLNKTKFDFPGTEEDQAIYDSYLDLLGSTLIFEEDASKIRVSNIKKTYLKVTPTGNPNNILTGQGNLPTGTYSYNTQTFSNYTQEYRIPAYDITYVVEHPNVEATSPTVQQLIADGNGKYFTTRKEAKESSYDSDYGYGVNKKTIRIGSYRDRVNSYLNDKSLTSLNLFVEKSLSTSGAITQGFSMLINNNIPSNTASSLWVKHNGEYYLKKDFLTTDLVYGDRAERIELFMEMVEGDYRKTKVKTSWWKKALSIILAIVAVVIVIVTVGVGSGPAGVIMAMALAVTTFSLVLSLIAFAWQSAGSYGAAQWVGRFNEAIAPLVMVASIILAFNSIINVIKNAASTAASAASAAASGGASAAQQMAKDILSWAIQKIKGISFNQALKIFSKAFEYVKDQRLEKIQNELKEKQEELEKYQEAKEEHKYTDIARAMMHSLANPLTYLESDYQFDRPYEPIYGEYHTGNSCRTTKIALYGEGAKTYVSNIV